MKSNKILTELEIAELKYMIDCITSISDFNDKYYYDAEIGSMSSYIIADYKENKAYLKSLRLFYLDLINALLDLPAPQFAEISNILKIKFAIDLNQITDKATKKINSIISVQKIQNEEEYYFVKNYTERIATDDNYATQTALLDDILFQFENKK